MEAMTLEQVRDRIDRLAGENKVYAYIHLAELTEWVIAIDAHLAQPAQAVDVEKRVREIEYAISCGELNAPAVFTQMRQLIPRALSGEKAGPVGDEDMALIPRHYASNIQVAACMMEQSGNVLDRREAPVLRKIAALLAASPTPDKERA